jgi:hypothetical protein
MTDYLVVSHSEKDGIEVATIRGKETLEMPRKTYLINLSEEDRARLLEMTRKGSLKTSNDLAQSR